MSRKPKPSRLDLRVVFDTNALFTGSASYFLTKEIGELMQQNSELPDISIRWIVPEIVRHEREFQMRQEALLMLPTIQKLERLLSHNLNITDEILQTRVTAAVERQVQQYGIVVQPLDVNQVDWPRLIMDAAYRRPPFQLGKTEKGFRDALIVETFLQIVVTAPAGRSVTRIALVSGDQLLRDATQARIGSSTNVHLLDSIDALKGLINTLGSTVDEQYIDAVKERAADVFYKQGDRDTLYYREAVTDMLKQRLSTAQLNLPAGATNHEVEKWVIRPPRFVRKERQRIYWATRVEARLKAVKSPVFLSDLTHLELGLTTAQAPSGGSAAFDTMLNSLSAPEQREISRNYEILRSSAPPTFTNIPWEPVIASGTASLDVSWSVAVTTKGSLTKPQVESVDFIEVVWV